MRTLLLYLALASSALASPGLAWDPSQPKATEYRVFSSVNGGPFNRVATANPITGTSWDFTFPLPAGERSFYVNAVYGTTIDSAKSNVATLPAPPKKARQNAKFFYQWWNSLPH